MNVYFVPVVVESCKVLPAKLLDPLLYHLHTFFFCQIFKKNRVKMHTDTVRFPVFIYDFTDTILPRIRNFPVVPDALLPVQLREPGAQQLVHARRGDALPAQTRNVLVRLPLPPLRLRLLRLLRGVAGLKAPEVQGHLSAHTGVPCTQVSLSPSVLPQRLFVDDLRDNR